MPKVFSPGPQWDYMKVPSSSRTSSPYTSDGTQSIAAADAHGDQTQSRISKRKGRDDMDEPIVKKSKSDGLGKYRASISGRSSKPDSLSVDKENSDPPRPGPSQSLPTPDTAKNQSGKRLSSATSVVPFRDGAHVDKDKASPIQVKREPKQQLLSRMGAQKSRTVSLDNYLGVVDTSQDRNSIHVKRLSQDSQAVAGPSRNVASSNFIEVIEISSDDDEVPSQGVRAGSSFMKPPSSIIPKPPPSTSHQKTPLSRPLHKPALTSPLPPLSPRSRPNPPPPSEVIELSSESDATPQSPPLTSPSLSPPPPRHPRLDFARKRTARKRANTNLMAMGRRRSIRSSEDEDEQGGRSPFSVGNIMDVEEGEQPTASQRWGSLKKPFHLTRDLDLNKSVHESNDGMQTEVLLHAVEARPGHRGRPKTSETTLKARGPSISAKPNKKSVDIDMTELQDALETSKSTGREVGLPNKTSTTAASSVVQPARKSPPTSQSLADAITEAGQKNVGMKGNLGGTTSLTSAGSRSSLSEIRARRNLGVKPGYSELGKQGPAPSPVQAVTAEDDHATMADTSKAKQSKVVSGRDKGKGKARDDPQTSVKSMSSSPASLPASPLHSEMEVAPDPDTQLDVERRNGYATEPHLAVDSEGDAQHTSGRSSVDRDEGMSLPENGPSRPRRTKIAPRGTYVEMPFDELNIISPAESSRSSPSLATDDTPLPISREFGGYKSITWETERQRLLIAPPKYYRASDLPHALQDQMNWMIERNPYNLQGTRHVFEASIFENTMNDEPDAPSITIINDVDSEVTPPWEFYYSNQMWHGEAVPPPDINGLVHCDCVGKCDPKSKTCKCLQRQLEFGDGVSGDFAYDSKGKLKVPDYPIFECNLLCRCGDDCRNRVVQHGRQVALNIRKTQKKGWGVFAVKKILKGSFIGIYAGELLTDAEGEKRGKTYDSLGRTYLFDLDFHHLREGANWSTKYVVDAYHAGNFTRFLNHSCDPNSSLYPCYVNEKNIDKPLLAIFSTRDIEADEEICFSYTGDADPDDDEADDNQECMPSPPPGSDAAMTATVIGENTTTTMTVTKKKSQYERCSCGAPNCKGNFF